MGLLIPSGTDEEFEPVETLHGWKAQSARIARKERERDLEVLNGQN